MVAPPLALSSPKTVGPIVSNRDEAVLLIVGDVIVILLGSNVMELLPTVY
jgi:hypothetical protein